MTKQVLAKALVPIRDTHQDDCPIVFVLEFYGLDSRQLSMIQMDGREPDKDIGSWPIRRALERRGFDTERYKTFIWDLW